MVQLTELVQYIDSLLEVDRFRDYAPNGLQVEGKGTVNKIVCGVTACQALIDAAITARADAVLVHHGYFWKGESEAITGMKRQRIKSLLDADISLLAYHLPLDAHATLGNNAQLADLLGLTISGTFPQTESQAVGMHGKLAQAISAEQLLQQLENKLDRTPMHIAGSDKFIETVAWCSGGAQGYIEAAALQGVDAYISGEISEQTVHIAREYGLHYFAAGHHATERYGVQALTRHLADRFAVQSQYIDIDNPV